LQQKYDAMGTYSMRTMMLMLPLIGVQVVSAIFFQAIWARRFRC